MTAIDGADALVIVTEWDEFRALDLDRVAGMLASGPVSSTCATSMRRYLGEFLSDKRVIDYPLGSGSRSCSSSS